MPVYCEIKGMNCHESLGGEPVMQIISGLVQQGRADVPSGRACCGGDDFPEKARPEVRLAEQFSRQGQENLCSACRQNVMAKLNSFRQ